MAVVRPFHGILPTPEAMPRVAAVPYDVVSREEAARLAEGNPLSFLRVSRPEIELPEGADPHSPAVYARAAANYARLKLSAPLLRDAEPRFYAYAQEVPGRRQLGVAAAASVDDYDSGVILKHEKTRQDKEDDRTRHVLALRSHSGPVFLAFKDDSGVCGLMARAAEGRPYCSFQAEDGVRHTLWKMSAEDSRSLHGCFKSVARLYICDGHHRAASASRARAAMREANPASPRGAWDSFLAVVFPASQLRILPYNRVVKDLNGMGPEAFLKAAGAAFDVAPADAPEPPEPGVVCVYVGGSWMRLSFKGRRDGLSPIERLDVSILQDNLLAPVLGIDDPRTSKRIDFVGGVRGVRELERMVDSGAFAAAFSMYPTSMEQLFDVADNGMIMPPKSTWFEPKLRDGVVCHDF